MYPKDVCGTDITPGSKITYATRSGSWMRVLCAKVISVYPTRADWRKWIIKVETTDGFGDTKYTRKATLHETKYITVVEQGAKS